MKANITLKLDTDLLREVKVLAAQRGISVSQMLTDRLEEAVREDRDYAQAMRRALKRMRTGTGSRWIRPASRDELYER